MHVAWLSCFVPILLADVFAATAVNDTESEMEISAEKRLLKLLMRQYEWVGRAGRPVRNVTTATHVSFALGLIQMDLNEREKVLTVSMWTRYTWRDEYLIWDPDMYDGVTTIHLDPFALWIPDIYLYNTADVNVPARETMAVVSNDGTVHYYPHCIFRSACSVDITNFPFDKQACNLAFGSWTHNSREINLTMGYKEGIDLTTFHAEHRDSSAWEVTNVTALQQLMPPNEEPNFSVLQFELQLKRKVVFSTYILTLPCIFLAFLTLVVFWLPPERPDRTALAMSTFGSFMVLLLILIEASPPTSHTIPTLGVYYCFNMVVIALTIVMSSMIINVSRGPKDGVSDLPICMTVVLLKGLSRILGLGFIYTKLLVVEKRQLSCGNANDYSTESSRMIGNEGDGKLFHGSQYSWPIQSSCACPMEDVCIHKLGKNMESLQKALVRIESKVSSAPVSTDNQLRTADIYWKWKSAGMVMDRVFFFFYMMLNILALVVFFPRPNSKPLWT